MHKLKSLALLALAGLGLSASGGVTTNDWWDVTFESDTFQEGFPGLVPGELGPLTNDASKATVIQPYATGVWTALDGDESYVTNSLATNWVNGAMTEVSNTTYIKLDTQGNDLKWAVADNNAMADGLKALVDADLYLVGSDSPPDAADFDAGKDVQTAVYLKNEIEEDSGETTNSVLCVYVYNAGTKANDWQELDGVELEDNAWAHVQVLVDHSDDLNNPPTVQVFVNGTQMHARNGDATSWTAANGSASQTAGRVSSVAFRGTGAVDNFVGQTILDDPDKFDFTAEVYMNGQLQPVGTEGNVSRVVISNDVGKTAKFEGFLTCNANFDREIDPTWSLTKIEITNFVNGLVTTLNYSWNSAEFRIEGDESDAVEITTASGWQTGSFNVSPSTAGATANSTIVKIYFEDLPEEGTFNAQATTTIGGTTTTDSQKVKPSDFEGGATKTITWAFPAEKNGNVLSTIQLYNGATLEYANKTATVTVTTNAALQADTLFAAATYVPGSLAEGQDLKDDGGVDGLYTFTAYVPPVALRITVAEGTVKTNEYPSLLLAIQAAEAGETVYLVADDRVSFSAGNTEIAIGKALTIDGGSNTLYGVSGYAYDGVNDHDIFIGAAAGDVTIRNLRITEFSDTAPTVQYRTYPIWTSQGYAGKLTLDGVTIDKFARTAINLGNGTFEITNCVIKGCAGDEGAPERYFQNAFGVLNAKGTVADTTATGLGSTANPWGAGVVTFNSDGDGELTFLSGTYTSDYVLEVSSNAVGKLAIEGGTFVATADAADSAFQLDEGDDATFKVEVSGGWFDREPEEGFIADGLAAYEDAPGTDAPWTVRAAKVTIDFYVDGAVYATTSVVVGATGYAPADPEKAADAQYAYAFTGWTNVVGESYSAATLPAATTATNYYAAFTATARQYDVEWIVDGVYTTNTWNYDATPSWNENDPTAVPTKDSTEATNFTFKAWTPEVAKVTGPGASYTATWTETVREYTVTWVIDATTSNMVQVAYGTVPAYTGEAPAKEGYTFLGWNSDSTATEALASLPAVTGEATYYAVFQEDTPVVVKVNPGDGLAAYNAAHADDPDFTPVEPIAFSDAATPLCEISFVAPEAGTYVLLSSTTVDGTYNPETGVDASKTVAASAVVTLTEGSTSATGAKFFKIGYEK